MKHLGAAKNMENAVRSRQSAAGYHLIRSSVRATGRSRVLAEPREEFLPAGFDADACKAADAAIPGQGTDV
jgi:hypothetical protein